MVRPEGRRVLSLNGSWDIGPGAHDAPPDQWVSRVPVPGVVDCAVPAYDWASSEYHWYRTTFRGREEFRSGLLHLRIGHAMFGTRAWLNGALLGHDIACYTPQEYRCDGAGAFRPDNELLIRVGMKSTLPPESAVGKDQERTSFVPGIWGDVSLVSCGNPRITNIQVIPRIGESRAMVRVTVENVDSSPSDVVLGTLVREHAGKTPVTTMTETAVTLPGAGVKVLELCHTVPSPRLWSPDDPFLYELDASVKNRGAVTDGVTTIFGMREFKVAGSDFLLNGRRVFLKGGNIAFHRFLSDVDRGTLPWDEEWIRRVLIDIPKAHNFNFFRNHLGPLYSRWYDIADECGMLLQNEWCFWTTTGTKEQITAEFTAWLRENWNHPSIIIWDALNESTDPVVQAEVVPEMKQLDPTRPWESVDFVEQHPYIFSLGPVLNDARLGFADAIHAIETSAAPSVVNEFLWWWLDNRGQPTGLTEEVVERWLGPGYSPEDLLGHQAYLAGELVELFRRMRVDAIQPFVYLSNNNGPTAHWFLGNIRDLRPKPVMRALKNAFSPFGVSMELWDRHWFPSESRRVRVFVFNDHPNNRRGTLTVGFADETGEWVSFESSGVDVEGGGYAIHPVEIRAPAREGSYFVQAVLSDARESEDSARSRKIAYVIARPDISRGRSGLRIALLDDREENNEFLQTYGIRAERISTAMPEQPDVLIVGEGMARTARYARLVADWSRDARKETSVLVLEPEYNLEDRAAFTLHDGVRCEISRRPDRDRGGYDSYVFPVHPAHPVWKGIRPEHLQMLNGGFGGEMVSQHDLVIPSEHEALARCGLRLKVLALACARRGRRRILISRIQTRGRLLGERESSSLYARRPDPVAHRYLLNLLAWCSEFR